MATAGAVGVGADEAAAIGAGPEVAGFALAGARVYPADDAAQARSAWCALPATVGVVILTQAAADAIGEQRWAAGAALTVVIPP